MADNNKFSLLDEEELPTGQPADARNEMMDEVGATVASHVANDMFQRGTSHIAYSLKQLGKQVRNGTLTTRSVSIVACLALIIASFLGLFLFLTSPVSVILNLYILFFALILLLLEVHQYIPTSYPTKFVRLIAKHAYFLTTVIGRAMFYIFVGFLCVFIWDALHITMGIIAMLAGGVVMYFGYEAHKKLSSLKKQVQSEDELVALFREKYADGSGYLNSTELAALSQQLGSRLSHQELEAAIILLDENGDGRVSLEEFKKWWLDSNSSGFVQMPV